MTAAELEKRRDWKGPATRGPYGVQYFTHFDMNCIYGNEFTMKARQVRHLQRLLGSTNPKINYYVCGMNKTFTSPTQRMYFSVHFTKEFLLPFLETPIDHLRIQLAGTSIQHRVRLMKGTDGRATVTSNWPRFVRVAGIQQGDILAFVFNAR